MICEPLFVWFELIILQKGSDSIHCAAVNLIQKLLKTWDPTCWSWLILTGTDFTALFCLKQKLHIFCTFTCIHLIFCKFPSVFSSVPPKPSHLKSPVTPVASPLSAVQKTPLRSNMEDRGGKPVPVARERMRDKTNKVSDLISRFEESR